MSKTLKAAEAVGVTGDQVENAHHILTEAGEAQRRRDDARATLENAVSGKYLEYNVEAAEKPATDAEIAGVAREVIHNKRFQIATAAKAPHPSGRPSRSCMALASASITIA